MSRKLKRSRFQNLSENNNYNQNEINQNLNSFNLFLSTKIEEKPIPCIKPKPLRFFALMCSEEDEYIDE